MVTMRSLRLVAIVVALACLRPPASSGRSDAGRGDRGSKARTERARVRHVRYIQPAGSGDRSGADRFNAAKLADIDEMIRLVGPGGTVHVLADAGPYLTADPITISHGGSAGDPVQVKGVDHRGVPARALITGTRTSPCPPCAC